MSSLISWTSTLFGVAASTCGSCRPLVLARIAETWTASTVLALLAPVIALGLIALAVHLAQRP